MKKYGVLLLLVIFFVNGLAQTNTENRIHTIRDSLEFVYTEQFQRKMDSLKADFELQKQKFLNKYNVERDQYARKIEALADSLKRMELKPPVVTAQPAKATTIIYDPVVEANHFSYLTDLKEREKKSSSFLGKLGFGGGKLIEFQLLEMNAYLQTYFPDAHCEKIQDYIIELSLDNKMYARAEMEFLKYAYLYISTENYTLTIDRYLAEFGKIRYYKDRTPFISNKVNSVLKKTELWERYFAFVELLSSYPEAEVKAFFMSEANQYLTRFADKGESARVIFWMANSYYVNGDPQKALVTNDKLMAIYPKQPVYADALFLKAKIQKDEFKEYENAIASYESYIHKFPDRDKARVCMSTIAKIYDENLKKYEQAISYYRQFADEYPADDEAVTSLNRIAEIYHQELKVVQSAVDIYVLIQDRYPQTDAGRKALLNSGLLYEEKDYYKNALVQYAEVYKNYPKTEESLTALERSVVIYLDKMGDTEKGKELLQMIINDHPDTKSAKAARERLDEILEKEREEAAAVQPDTSAQEGGEQE